MSWADWLAEAEKDGGGSLPAWWPIAALMVPLLVTLIVALIQRSGAVRAAQIAAQPKPDMLPPTEVITEEVMRVLGEELDKRLGHD